MNNKIWFNFYRLGLWYSCGFRGNSSVQMGRIYALRLNIIAFKTHNSHYWSKISFCVLDSGFLRCVRISKISKIHKQMDRLTLSFVWLCMTVYDCVWLFMTMYDYLESVFYSIWLYSTLSCLVWLELILFDHVWPRLTVFDCVWLCFAIFLIVWYHSTVWICSKC